MYIVPEKSCDAGHLKGRRMLMLHKSVHNALNSLTLNFGDLPQIWGARNIKIFTTFFMTFALDTAYLRNETSHRQTKMLVSIYNVSPKT